MSTLKVDGIRSNSASSDAITLASDGTCTANITNKSNRNLVINGAMLVAQRATSSTDEGMHTVDRFKNSRTGNDEAPTYAQVDVASGTTPYTLGFRKAFKVTNGNQTNGAGTSDMSTINYQFESQDIATSGWNYTSSSSYITLSFWVKSSVAQNFYFSVFTQDGTSQQYTMETGSLTADTWTKITKTIPGNANVQFDTDTTANATARGLDIQWMLFRGTDNTGTRPLNAWAALDSATRSPDQTNTWYTTNDATFELTGVQLEVGSVATDFEHRSYGDELARCQRYYQKYKHGTYKGINFIGRKSGSDTVVGSMYGFPPMRAAATGSVTSAGAYRLYRTSDATTHVPSSVTVTHENDIPYNVLKVTVESAGTFSTGNLCAMYNTSTAGELELDAEV